MHITLCQHQFLKSPAFKHHHCQRCGQDVMMLISHYSPEYTHTHTPTRSHVPTGDSMLHVVFHAVNPPLHKNFQKRSKHSYRLMQKSKNIIQLGNKQSATDDQDKASNQGPINQFKTPARPRQVRAASQVHLHRPRSASKQQSRSVITGCCCQRSWTHSHEPSHGNACSQNSGEHLHAQANPRSLPSKQSSSLFNTCSSSARLVSVRHFRTSSQVKTTAVLLDKRLPTRLQTR